MSRGAEAEGFVKRGQEFCSRRKNPRTTFGAVQGDDYEGNSALFSKLIFKASPQRRIYYGWLGVLIKNPI